MTTTPCGVRATGSSSPRVLGQVAGPRRKATVLHSGVDAVYLAVGGTCLAVLARAAVPVPCGVRTTLGRVPPVANGAPAVVGGGSVKLPGCAVVVTSVVDPTVPRLTPAAVAWGTAWATAWLAERPDPRLGAVRAALPGAALDRLSAGDTRAVLPLLGLGPGLTPLGDDVLSGWLAAAVAARHPALEDLRGEVAGHAARRTTTLSATLLQCASRGEAVPQFRSLVAAVAGADPGAAGRSAAALRGIGDTSGAGMLLGALVAWGSVR